MLIQCTKALLDKMDITRDELKSPEGHEHFPESLMAWHANIVNIIRRKAVILMNNETRYSVIIYRPRPKDFARMKELISEAIIVALCMEGVREDVIESYMTNAGEIAFSKTANRSMVASLQTLSSIRLTAMCSWLCTRAQARLSTMVPLLEPQATAS